MTTPGRRSDLMDAPPETLTTEMIAHVAEAAAQCRIRTWRNLQTGEEFYVFDRLTGAPIDGVDLTIDQAIASAQARRRSA